MQAGILVFALAVTLGVAPRAHGGYITIEGDSPSATNCYPFGGPPTSGYNGFIYQNVPAFTLAAGDVLAFDTLFQNDQTITVTIALATATSNGSHVPNGSGFTTVASNATPASPKGDSVLGNYDLAFTVSTPFVFAGGGLIIRVLPVGAYASDTNCSAGLIHYLASDSTDFFVGRFLNDANGLYPWTYEDAFHIGGFRLSIAALDCGNGALDGVEQCDDGNPFSGDCCSSTCTFEASGASCTDGNPCTTDACNGAGTCIHTNNTASCDDDVFCNGSDTCSGGTCTVHAGDPCTGGAVCARTCSELFEDCFASFGTPCTDDGNPCTNDSCDGNGACLHTSNTAPCDDGLFCNGADTCAGGTCSSHAGDPCAGGAECNATCTEATDSCLAGAGTPCATDGNSCTTDTCNGSGACLHTAHTGACNDGVFCNGADTCSGGLCTVHAGDPCAGGAQCAIVCDETNDVCADPPGTPCADGLFCNGADTCLDGTCSVHAGEPCAGGAVCNATCQEATDTCLADAGTACTTDGNPCTDDTCDGSGACLHTNNTAPCNDGLFCNGADTCSGGACTQHVGDPCAGGAECNATCQETTDSCFASAGTACTTDNNPCTEDTCNGSGTCLHANNTAPCNDDLFCNGADTCAAGACTQHAGDPCAGGAECATTCNETADVCADAAATPCTDDGNPCTDDTCDGSGVCRHTNNTAPCNDGLFCNGVDTCSGGACTQHVGDPCAGGAECNATCQEASDTCFAGAGTACTTDGNPCTDDTCDGSGTCLHTNNTGPCDDGIFCNGADTCAAGACSQHPGDPCIGGAECATVCNETADLCAEAAATPCTDDGNPCTDDACDGSGTCHHANNTAPCDDGLFCNGADTCSGGACAQHVGDPCTGGADCNATCTEATDSCLASAGAACTTDGNPCTDDTCDGTGTCLHTDNTAPCDDGLFCNGADTCAAGACTQHPGDPCTGGAECATVCNETDDLCAEAAAIPCTDDGNPCTDDACNGTGACVHPPNTAPCDDGLFCNGADTCGSGTCSAHAGDPCVGGAECNATCQETTDTCLADAGAGCTTDGNPCTDDICDGSGSCHHPDNTAPCDDGLFCNGADTCAAGACTQHPGDPCAGGAECAIVCNETADTCADAAATPCADDGNPCTDDACDGSGACVHPPNTVSCDDGLFCNGADTCAGGACSQHGGDPCAGGAECNATCQEATDTCLADAGDPCATDGNPCTDDTCDGNGTCLHTDNTAPCDDGLFCNGADTCAAGACTQHPGDPCAGGAECATFCDETADTCADAAATPCTDDGNPCTDDTCDGSGACVHTNNTASCDDGLFCNGADTCGGGTCSVHAGDPCAGGAECNATCQEATDTCFAGAGTACTTDGNPCTDDTCDGSGTCQHTNNTAPCDDGLFCNGADTCAAGACTQHVGDPCAGGAECATTCNETTDVCANAAATPCSDDGNPCTDDACDGSGDCLHTNNTAPCDDALFCNGADTCAAGACTQHVGDPCAGGAECNATCQEATDTCFAGAGTACTTDGNPCTDDTCDGSGTCHHTNNSAPCDDSLFCNGADTCAAGACTQHVGDPCAGGAECVTTCNETTDVCADAAATPCSDDGNPCTDDACDGSGDCLHTHNTAPCDDALFCNGADTCAAGACTQHVGDPCAGGAECNATCQEATDTCFAGAGTACTTDGNPCTDDTCDGSGTCDHTNNTAPCDDNLFCNGADTCAAGACTQHVGDPCAGGAECNATCQEATDTCSAGAGTACTTDGNPCTDDTCDGSGACLHTNNTAPCNDGLFCNGADTCSGGSCTQHVGDPCAGGAECNATCQETTDSCFASAGTACTTDTNPCTDDTCNGSGTCLHANNTAPCNDGLFCNGADTCAAGACAQHAGDPCAGGAECATTCNETADVCADAAATSCSDDGNPCTDDTCDGSGACVHPPNTVSCDDGIFCNGADTCGGGTCSAHAGDPCTGGAECNATCQEATDTCLADAGDPCATDGNPCTDDTCNGSGTCLHTDNTAPCDDGLFCNGADTCAAGACTQHPGDPCAGGAECATFCDETADTCANAAATPCTDDGNPCTDDTCDGSGACVHTNNTASCDDGLFCNGADTCGGGTCSVHAGDPCAGGAECNATCQEATDTCFAGAGTACTTDGNPCTDDTCDGSGTCQHTNNSAPCDDSLFCNGADTCAAGACTQHVGDPCAGGAECVTTCNETTDVCADAAATPCSDDGNPCTDDACDGSGDCLHTHNTAPCDDALFCNGADTCAAGACTQHVGDPCAGGAECNATCQEATDTCFAGAGTACTTDGNPCTDDTCDGSGTCHHTNNTAPCDDSLFCNGADTCAAGACTQHLGDPCAAGAECATTCNETTDACANTAATPCADDGNPCTDDACNGSGTCLHTHNTAPCDDGLFCNGPDTCAAGACTQHAGDPCAGGAECATTCDETTDVCADTAATPCADDGNPCTDDVCDGTGACVHTGHTGACDDGVYCNGADTCSGGMCTVHAGDPCTGGAQCAATCDETNDVCADPPDTPCSDGLFCNGTDTCLGGTCSVHAGDPCLGGAECATVCNETTDVCADAAATPCTDDGNPCTDDACDGSGLCLHPHNTAPCDDGLFCTGPDACAAGACTQHAGDPCAGGAECATACNETTDVCADTAATPCTDDGNPCTDDVCDGSGSCLHPPNTAPCDDGLFCTGPDACAAGACTQHAGDPCAGGAECATACNETSDVCADTAATPCTDDGNPCTDDACDGSGTCLHPPNTAPCDDGLFCTGLDTCAAGACTQHAGDPCAGGAECATTCNETTDSCFEPAGTPCADDGDLCSSESCDGAGTCRHAFVPALTCDQPIARRAALLSIQSGATKRLAWTLQKGPATTKAKFGSPTQSTAYALCIYEEDADILSLALTSQVRSGGTCGGRPCWKETPTGFEYTSRLPRRGGLDKVKLKAGKKAGKTAILVRRSGPNVTLPSLPLDPNTTVTVQLRSSLGACWGARYSAASRNDATHFKATSD